MYLRPFDIKKNEDTSQDGYNKVKISHPKKGEITWIIVYLFIGAKYIFGTFTIVSLSLTILSGTITRGTPKTPKLGW
jgi:hypothetical protein